MSTQHKNQDSIVANAIDIESAEEREAYLDQACGEDGDLRRQVEQRVEEHFQEEDSEGADRTTDRRKSSPEQASKQKETNRAEDREHRIVRIGSFRVQKEMGESASAIVYQAEQQGPVELKVALKVIKHGLDWRQVIARFEPQRQKLLRIEHPNIAKLFGAGTRPSGQPYFVVELVEGLPLTKYCDKHRQRLQQRLEMFVTVCKAVQYAHQNGIIHGDLKPSNVLVSGHDDKPAPKILDLGVAKAVRRKVKEDDPSIGPLVLGNKPEYLSPEQADPNAPDIDTRSDVYSLGVLLYELVTGSTPLTPDRLKDVSMPESLRLIREEETSAPSARLHESKERLDSQAAKLQMKSKALFEAVRNDLDCVVMKALQKAPADRYDTVSELARDIQRYLDKEPVEACPPSSRSQFRTLMRKHSRLTMIAAMILFFFFAIAATSAGLTVWAWMDEKHAKKEEAKAHEKQEKAEKSEKESKGKLEQADKAYKEMKRERDGAREEGAKARATEQEMRAIMTFIKNKLLSAGRPGDVSLESAFWAGSQGKDVTVRKNVTLRTAVDEAEAKVASAFGDRPLTEAMVREMLGLAYLNLGEAARAVKQYERAFALREANQGDKHPETADVRNQLAIAYRLAGNTVEASRLFHHTPDSSTHADALATRGSMLLIQKKPAEAEMSLRESLIIRDKIQPHNWVTYETKSLVGEALLEQNKYADAEPFLLSGYQGMKQRESRIPSADKKRLTDALKRVVRLYQAWGKPEKASKWQKELEATETPKQP